MVPARYSSYNMPDLSAQLVFQPSSYRSASGKFVWPLVVQLWPCSWGYFITTQLILTFPAVNPSSWFFFSISMTKLAIHDNSTSIWQWIMSNCYLVTFTQVIWCHRIIASSQVTKTYANKYLQNRVRATCEVALHLSCHDAKAHMWHDLLGQCQKSDFKI